MNQHQQPPGRFLEILVGFVTSFISLIFAALFLMLVTGAGFKYITFLGGSILLLGVYWFGCISYRLIFNVPNKNGGLFSIGGLKFLSVFLGISFLAVTPLAIYMGHWGAVVGCISMSIACGKGWKMASARGSA